MNMNNSQKKIIGVALFIFAISCIYAPFNININGNLVGSGFQFIWQFDGEDISLKMLFLEWVAIGVITCGLVFLNKSNE